MAVVEGVGKWLDVLHLLASGQRLRLQPTLVTCATSLAACRYGRWAWTRAVQLFASHFEGSGPCGPWPTLVVANAFLGALSTFGQWRTVAKVLEDLCMWRLQPDHHTLASAASALSRDTDVWMQTASLLQNFGMQPDYSSLASLLSICEWQPLSCSHPSLKRTGSERMSLLLLNMLQASATRTLAQVLTATRSPQVREESYSDEWKRCRGRGDSRDCRPMPGFKGRCVALGKLCSIGPSLPFADQWRSLPVRLLSSRSHGLMPSSHGVPFARRSLRECGLWDGQLL